MYRRRSSSPARHPIEDCADALRALPSDKSAYALSLDITAVKEGYSFSLHRRGYRATPVEIIGRLRPDGDQTQVLIDQKRASALGLLVYLVSAVLIVPLMLLSNTDWFLAIVTGVIVAVIMTLMVMIGIAFGQERAMQALHGALEKKVLKS